jgi:hypothetical protein
VNSQTWQRSSKRFLEFMTLPTQEISAMAAAALAACLELAGFHMTDTSRFSLSHSHISLSPS